MDQDQWTEYREAVLRYTEKRLAEAKAVAEGMGDDVLEATFKGHITVVAGAGRYESTVLVGSVPLFEDDEGDDDDA